VSKIWTISCDNPETVRRSLCDSWATCCKLRRVGRKFSLLENVYSRPACNVLPCFITALHLYGGRSYPWAKCPSVRPSVRPSVKHVNCEKTKESCAYILIPHERPFILVFYQEEWLVGDNPSIGNSGSNWPVWSENADFQSVFGRSASAVTSSLAKKFSLH